MKCLLPTLLVAALAGCGSSGNGGEQDASSSADAEVPHSCSEDTVPRMGGELGAEPDLQGTAFGQLGLPEPCVDAGAPGAGAPPLPATPTPALWVGASAPADSVEVPCDVHDECHDTTCAAGSVVELEVDGRTLEVGLGLAPGDLPDVASGTEVVVHADEGLHVRRASDDALLLAIVQRRELEPVTVEPFTVEPVLTCSTGPGPTCKRFFHVFALEARAGEATASAPPAGSAELTLESGRYRLHDRSVFERRPHPDGEDTCSDATSPEMHFDLVRLADGP